MINLSAMMGQDGLVKVKQSLLYVRRIVENVGTSFPEPSIRHPVFSTDTLARSLPFCKAMAQEIHPSQNNPSVW